jgi:uncharacterized membrane protein YphA (DoxX/SURF4 family)
MTGSFKTYPNAGLLILRLGVGATSVLLFVLKHAGAVTVFHPGRAWPVLLAAGAALITLGFCTRLAAACMALSWAWAFGTGLYFGQPFYLFPVRAFLFVIVFTALAFTGAGRFSVDRILQTRR